MTTIELQARFAKAVEDRLASAASEGRIEQADQYLTPAERRDLDDYTGQLMEYDATDVRLEADLLIECRREQYAAEALMAYGAFASVPATAEEIEDARRIKR